MSAKPASALSSLAKSGMRANLSTEGMREPGLPPLALSIAKRARGSLTFRHDLILHPPSSCTVALDAAWDEWQTPQGRVCLVQGLDLI